ncbi:streptophobe family protein [Streptomyces sp. NPDC127069]|uniref:streptophobe family protein n=1 Tax=Streptomyces sp. NPDC127069 TaxID=3347128 RepID=UPI0036593512
MRRIRWGDVLLSGIAAVGWSVAAMAGVAALGLHLLGADAEGGSLSAMTAAVVAAGVGGSVTASGEVSALGVAVGSGAVLDLRPLGVALAGALVLGWVFLRGLRGRPGAVEVAVRAVVVGALFLVVAGGLAWAGQGVAVLEGVVPPSLPRVPPKVVVPGIGDVGGLLPDGLGDAVLPRVRVGFAVDPGPTAAGAGVWVAVVLGVALLASRYGPAAVWAGRLRAAVSSVLAMLVVAVVAGVGAAVWAGAGAGRPERVAGASLLVAPDASWTGLLLGLSVPVRGRAAGELGRLLPPLSRGEPVTVARLAEYDGRAWLLVAGAGVLLLYAGVRAAVRSPGRGVAACAAWLGGVTGVALAGVVWLTGVSVDVPGVAVELRGDAGYALLAGAGWGALAGGTGALLTRGTRAPAAGGPPPHPDPTRRPRPGPHPGPPGGRGPRPDRADRPWWPEPAGAGGRGAREPEVSDGSWDVTVTGRPPKPAGAPRPPRREPFAPPPPPGAPPPPKPPHPPR